VNGTHEHNITAPRLRADKKYANKKRLYRMDAVSVHDEETIECRPAVIIQNRAIPGSLWWVGRGPHSLTTFTPHRKTAFSPHPFHILSPLNKKQTF